MNIHHYYKTLGSSPSDSDVEVRRKFRKLALLYHPDRNSSPVAQEQFIAINEAYEKILTHRKNGSSTSSAKQVRKQTPREDRMQEAKKRYYEQMAREREANENYFSRLFQGYRWRALRITMYTGIILSIALIAEWFLPFHFENDTITHYGLELTSLREDEKLSLLKTAHPNYFWVSEFEPGWIDHTRDIKIERTWIFHQAVSMIIQDASNVKILPIKLTFQSFKWVILMIFLLPLLTYFYRRKTSWYTVVYYLSITISPAIMALFLVLNNHLYHFLTLGFF